MSTEKNLSNLVINKVSSQEVYDYMKQNNLTNADELYFVQGETDYVKTSDLDSVAFDGYVTKGAESGSTVGVSATVEGANNMATTKQSHAEGGYTRTGNVEIYGSFTGSYDSYGYEHAEGYSTLAKGNSAHAEGAYTQAISSMSHAEGLSTIASSSSSHAEGRSTTASGFNSHAEGYSTTASGENSHAEGNSSTASLQASHAEGYSTTASGYASHAEGIGTVAGGSYQHVQGKNNIEDTSNTYAHIVGNGTSSSARSNAHTLDWSGNAWYSGKVSIGTTSSVPTPTNVNDLVTKQYVDNKFSTRTTSVTLASTDWAGTESPYSQEVIVDGATSNSKVDLQPTGEQLNSLATNRTILNTANDNGTVTVYAIGNKPTEDYTMQATITEV